jgi:hypothetical protein
LGYESINIRVSTRRGTALRAGTLFIVLPDHARLTIVFDLRADPIAGVVCGVGGRGAFAGWMELTRTIERALDAARQLPGPDEPDEPDLHRHAPS